MGPKENVACRWFAEVWNRKDADAIHRLGTPDMIAHGPDGSHRSPADFAAFHNALVTAVPDMHVDVKHCAEGRDMVAVQWVARGTHTGVADGMPKPSGRPNRDLRPHARPRRGRQVRGGLGRLRRGGVDAAARRGGLRSGK